MTSKAAVCTFDGKKVINLASNNYLGLTTHPKLREAALEATRKYGVGSGAGAHHRRHHENHMELEERSPASRTSKPAWSFNPGSQPMPARCRRCWAKRTSSSPTS
jgi:glycine C-acetyltransferase